MKQLLIILLLALPASLFAQDKLSKSGMDSLMRLLATARQDTNRVNVLNELSDNLPDNNADLGIQYANEAMALSKKLNWQPGIGKAHTCLAANYQTKSEHALVLDHYMQALKIYEAIGDKLLICRVLGNIGKMYYHVKEYEKALHYYSMSLDIAREIGDKAAIARNTGNMGTVYDYMGNPEKALEYLHIALKSNEERNYKRGTATNLTNIAGVYFTKKDFRMALDYHFRALRIYQETDNKTNVAMSMGNIGAVYAQIVKDSALNTKPDELISANKKDNLARAIDYMSKALVLAQEIGDLEEMMELTNNMHKTYKIARDYMTALEYYKKYIKLRDSVYSKDNMLQISALETKREADLKNKQIEINRLATSQKRNERIIYGAGLLVLLLIVLAVYRRYYSQKQMNTIQQEALQQKEMLMREIHHRVKNNLQVISALLDLQLTNITDDHAKDAITESTTRLKAISLIHHQLYQDNNITTIEATSFTSELHMQIDAVFSAPGQQISLHKQLPELMLDIDTAVPFGLILNELITNSYKYAFAGQAIGNIDLEVESAGDNKYKLIYRDSGPGLSATQDITTSKGLGLNIIRSLSKQLGGSFTYDRGIKSFIIIFKDLAGRKMTD